MDVITSNCTYNVFLHVRNYVKNEESCFLSFLHVKNDVGTAESFVTTFVTCKEWCK